MLSLLETLKGQAADEKKGEHRTLADWQFVPPRLPLEKEDRNPCILLAIETLEDPFDAMPNIRLYVRFVRMTLMTLRTILSSDVRIGELILLLTVEPFDASRVPRHDVAGAVEQLLLAEDDTVPLDDPGLLFWLVPGIGITVVRFKKGIPCPIVPKLAPSALVTHTGRINLTCALPSFTRGAPRALPLRFSELEFYFNNSQDKSDGCEILCVLAIGFPTENLPYATSIVNRNVRLANVVQAIVAQDKRPVSPDRKAEEAAMVAIKIMREEGYDFAMQICNRVGQGAGPHEDANFLGYQVSPKCLAAVIPKEITMACGCRRHTTSRDQQTCVSRTLHKRNSAIDTEAPLMEGSMIIIDSTRTVRLLKKAEAGAPKEDPLAWIDKEEEKQATNAAKRRRRRRNKKKKKQQQQKAAAKEPEKERKVPELANLPAQCRRPRARSNSAVFSREVPKRFKTVYDFLSHLSNKEVASGVMMAKRRPQIAIMLPERKPGPKPFAAVTSRPAHRLPPPPRRADIPHGPIQNPQAIAPAVPPAEFTYYTRLCDGSVNCTLDADRVFQQRLAYFLDETRFLLGLCAPGRECLQCNTTLGNAQSIFLSCNEGLCAQRPAACACRRCYRLFLYLSIGNSIGQTVLQSAHVVTVGNVQEFFSANRYPNSF